MAIVITAAAFIVIVLFLFLWGAIRKRKIDIWLPAYCKKTIADRIRPRSDTPVALTHILFCFVDHFEPGWGGASKELQQERLDGWCSKYPVFAQQFRDADGFHPRHTWFYPPHYFNKEHIVRLLSLCLTGYGEIEMHMHHSRMEPFPDNSETLKNKIQACIDLYSQYGIFVTRVDGLPQRRYAFIHGDWALDNSRPQYCGVNDEITILRQTGCYADFTFPSYMVESQPRTVNTIYYAKDNPTQAKSYDRGVEVRVGSSGDGDLMMIQGPLGFRWKKRKGIPIVGIEDGEISANNLPVTERVDAWISTGIHVAGRENWIVVKVFTHGAPTEHHDVLLGNPIREMHRYLNEKYNDGLKYALHYVTARELYNIIKAAEHGKDGNPGLFRDYLLEAYHYKTS
ncbi:MAG TPA: hypothetical protein VMT62_00675 [Syntrophorhabdaceae bacterium]|nr:hypothetical protein [Syntrophorhabdaceae bacterium]